MSEAHQYDIDLVCEYKYNLEFLGNILDQQSRDLNVISFSDFQKFRNTLLKKPKQIIRTLPRANNQVEQQLSDEFNRIATIDYNKHYAQYEQALSLQNDLKQYDNTKSGYAHYLTENFKNVTPFLNMQCKIPIKEQNRCLHTYISGGTGSGKSEAIKSFIWHYLTKNTNTGLILLTPHSKIAEQVAKFNVNLESDRLIYIEPNLDGYFPCLNPFDIPNKENLTDIEIEPYTNAFLSSFKEILSNLGDDELSLSMEVILKNTIPVIIKMPNSSVYDLIDFLEPYQGQGSNRKFSEKVQNLIEFANNNIKNQSILHFLNNSFKENPTYNASKFAIHTRLNAVFGTITMQEIMKGKATLNIENAINQRKLIVFNVSKGKNPMDYKIFGLFMISNIKILAFRRANQSNFATCHFFLDEFQNYITPSLQEMLEECRQFKLCLTFAQQQVGARMGTELRDSILGNTGVKITGINEVQSLSIMASNTGETVQNLQKNLSTGRFSVWQRADIGKIQQPPVFIDMPTYTLGNNQSMTQEQWEIIKNTQIQTFYRPMGQNYHTEPETYNLNKDYFNQ